MGLVIFLATSYFVKEQQQEIVANIALNIAEQEKTLTTIAEITDSNGVDSVVESIIIDCSLKKRARFDTLLNNLGTLTPTELEETSDLFDACAHFSAERKAVMVSRMRREFEVYRNLVGLLEIVDAIETLREYDIEKWAQLVNFEEKRSDIFKAQVVVQNNIIVALQNGEKVGSDTIAQLLADAKNINEEAIVTNHKIDTLRGSLLDI